MGKRIITQHRGRGTFTYRSPSHRYVAEAKYRKYDEKEKNNVVYGRIIDIVNCPGHSAPLVKIKYETGEIAYLIAPENIRVNEIIASGSKAPIQLGNILPLHKLPEGTDIFNVELVPGDGGKYCRTAGASAKVLTMIKDKMMIRLPSKQTKLINPNCRATIGVIAGSGRKEKPFIKAGRKYLAMAAKNKLYPRTSGVSMNAVDHPFGSGRGSHAGKPLTPPRFAPPGRNVGSLRAKRTGLKKK